MAPFRAQSRESRLKALLTAAKLAAVRAAAAKGVAAAGA
jgi:hypothetical protein